MKLTKENEVFEIDKVNGHYCGEHYEVNESGTIVRFWGMRDWKTAEEVEAFVKNKKAHGWT